MRRSGEGPFARWNHEYWPWYLIYMPVLPGLLLHAIRNRSLVFFTNVNPAIDMGGFFGERKSEIYALLPKGSYPTTLLIEPGTPTDEVLSRMRTVGLSFPHMVKPDTGERGDGVQRIEHEGALRTVLADQRAPLLLQELVPWEHEYGLMVMKDPATGRATLLSITGKRFLAVVGDGRSTVAQLLRATLRGRKQVQRLSDYKADLLAHVPMRNERVVVEPIGNHCRGTSFLDARHLATPALTEAVDALMDGTEGIYYGRLDVRSPSEEALQQGRFTILELNGVSSEPGHVYDPAMGIIGCWRELLRHVAHLPRLSRALRAQGHHPVPLGTLIARCEEHFGITLRFLRVPVWYLSGARRARPRSMRYP
ncbi:MAG: hypothetical protein ABI432_12975 [Flavobacteriales bacterium]